MRYRNIIGTCIATALGLSLPANRVAAQQPSLKEFLVETWTIVSWKQAKSDGTRLWRFGADPAGVAFLDVRGRYIIHGHAHRSARYASNSLWQGAAEENKQTADGTMTYFGTYTVNDVERSIAIHVEASSFPNWTGADQKRFIAIYQD